MSPQVNSLLSNSESHSVGSTTGPGGTEPPLPAIVTLYWLSFLKLLLQRQVLSSAENSN